MDKTKTVYQLDTPFSSVQWPKISQDDQDSILDLLCNLLSPIGQHRKAYVHPSKGKRIKARKRKRDDENEAQMDVAAPPPPVMAASVDVGLSSITRKLQLSAGSRSLTTRGAVDEKSEAPSPYSIILVARSGPPSAFLSHLPLMIAVASKSHQPAEPIRLVGFSKSCEERLSTCLGIPRVTSIALCPDDTVQSKALVDFVRERVAPVEAPWLEDAANGAYHQTKINVAQAPIGKKREKRT